MKLPHLFSSDKSDEKTFVGEATNDSDNIRTDFLTDEGIVDREYDELEEQRIAEMEAVRIQAAIRAQQAEIEKAEREAAHQRSVERHKKKAELAALKKSEKEAHKKGIPTQALFGDKSENISSDTIVQTVHQQKNQIDEVDGIRLTDVLSDFDPYEEKEDIVLPKSHSKQSRKEKKANKEYINSKIHEIQSAARSEAAGISMHIDEAPNTENGKEYINMDAVLIDPLDNVDTKTVSEDLGNKQVTEQNTVSEQNAVPEQNEENINIQDIIEHEEKDNDVVPIATEHPETDNDTAQTGYIQDEQVSSDEQISREQDEQMPSDEQISRKQDEQMPSDEQFSREQDEPIQNDANIKQENDVQNSNFSYIQPTVDDDIHNLTQKTVNVEKINILQNRYNEKKQKENAKLLQKELKEEEKRREKLSKKHKNSHNATPHAATVTLPVQESNQQPSVHPQSIATKTAVPSVLSDNPFIMPLSDDGKN